MAKLSPAIQRSRSQWHYTGQMRPSFAEPIEDGQESVWDYPRPPRLERDSRHVLVQWGETLIAQTNQAIRVLETASPPCFYLPREAVEEGVLVKVTGSSFCEWKGVAQWWSIALPDGSQIAHAAWSYAEPPEDFQLLAGFVSFYPARVACYVEGIRVMPQPGSYYGGWVTPEVVGPFKGLLGTENW